MGLPISKDQLLTICLSKSDEPGWQEWRKIYGAGTDLSSRKKLNIFLTRVIEKNGFAVRKETVSQKIPQDALAEKGAQRVREKFFKENNVVVLAAYESFIRFHEKRSYVLAPKDEKRIGSA